MVKYWMRRAFAAEQEAAQERGIRRHVQAEFVHLDRLYGDAILERDYLRARLGETNVTSIAA